MIHKYLQDVTTYMWSNLPIIKNNDPLIDCIFKLNTLPDQIEGGVNKRGGWEKSPKIAPNTQK